MNSSEHLLCTSTLSDWGYREWGTKVVIREQGKINYMPTQLQHGKTKQNMTLALKLALRIPKRE